MKTIKLQATLELTYETADQRDPQEVINELKVSFGRMAPPRDIDVVEWYMGVKEIDSDKGRTLAEAHRETAIGKISGYFSSDGPAVTISPIEGADHESVVGIFQEISSVLREAHHRYIRTVRGD